MEMKEKDRVDDALSATRAAVEGIVPGGGWHIRAIGELKKLKVTTKVEHQRQIIAHELKSLFV